MLEWLFHGNLCRTIGPLTLHSQEIMVISTEAKELALEYCASTSLHGVRYIVSSHHTMKKVGWILILGGVLVGSSYHISVLISSCLEYNYYTSVTLDTRKPLTVKTLNTFYEISS